MMPWNLVKIIELNTPSPRTGLVYTETAIRAALLNFKSPYAAMITDRDTTSVPLDRITHEVRNCRIEDNWLVAEVRILDTPLACELSEAGSTFKFYPVGLGYVSDGNMVKDYEFSFLRSDIK